MLKQKKWLALFLIVFMGFLAEVVAPQNFTKTANAEAKAFRVVTLEGISEPIGLLSTEDVWKDAYLDLMYAQENAPLREAMAEAKEQNLKLMASAAGRIVNYHDRRFVITEDDYQVLLNIVEAEAPEEDITGKMLVANVVLNRLELEFGGDTISEVVFARGQFEPVLNGRIFRVTPSETTIEAVERVLNGEDKSQGALYFMARSLASKSGVRWFDTNLKFLFKHGGHEFYTEKE